MASMQELIQGNLKLISLPAIVNRVNAMIDDPNASASDIAKVISQDVALTAQILKVVNSPLYQFPKQIETVSFAINILGTRQLRDLVLANAVITRFRKGVDAHFNLESFWCHSICSGIAARLVAETLQMNNTERNFVAGLLHDIGKMAIHLLLPEKSRELHKVLDNPAASILDIEHKIVGFTHGEMGAEILRAWNFPDSLVEVTRYHHQPAQAKHYLKDVAIVHVADTIANNLQPAISRDDDTLLEESALQILGLTHDIIEKINEQTYQKLDPVLQILYYDLAA